MGCIILFSTSAFSATHPNLIKRSKEKEASKKEWDSLISVTQREFNGLEGWLTKDPNPKVTNLQKLVI